MADNKPPPVIPAGASACRRCAIPLEEICFQRKPREPLNEFVAVGARFLYQKEDGKSSRRQRGGQSASDRFGERVKLRAVKSLDGGKPAGDFPVKQGRVGLRKYPDMPRDHLRGRRVNAEESQQAVVKRQDIGDAKEQVASHAQCSENLVINPEYFFCVLKNLVHDHEIDRFVVKRECVGFDICGNGRYAPFEQRVLVPQPKINPETLCLRVVVPDNHQVVPGPAAQIDTE